MAEPVEVKAPLTCEELVQRLLERNFEARITVTTVFAPQQVAKNRRVAVGRVMATIEKQVAPDRYAVLGKLITRGATVLEFQADEDVLYRDAKVIDEVLA